MKLVKGNKTQEMSREEFISYAAKYREIHIDVGTGDGRFVHRNAQKFEDILFIGVDPSHKQLEIYSKKSNKEKLENVLYVVGSIEMFPQEILHVANKVTVILPWGSLLQSIVLYKKPELETLFNIIRSNGELELLFGYSQEAEPTEVIRLKLDDLNLEYIKEKIVPAFIHVGFSSATLAELSKEELNNFESTWSKKLRFGNERPLFHLQLTKQPPKLLED